MIRPLLTSLRASGRHGARLALVTIRLQKDRRKAPKVGPPTRNFASRSNSGARALACHQTGNGSLVSLPFEGCIPPRLRAFLDHPSRPRQPLHHNGRNFRPSRPPDAVERRVHVGAASRCVDAAIHAAARLVALRGGLRGGCDNPARTGVSEAGVMPATGTKADGLNHP